MEKRSMKLDYSSAISDIVEINPSFDKGILRIAYTGKNRNNSYISKEAFEKAIPTMYCCPVVANYIRDIDEIGSHDGEFIKDDSGDYKYVNLTTPVGFVPPQSRWYWDEVDDNNQIHQYLTTEVILWKRQEAYSKIKENGITEQSMEIDVYSGEMKDDYYEINDFCFTAFCLLGTAEPCFESAALFTFTHNDELKDEIRQMMSEYSLEFASDRESLEKEEEKLKKITELCKKYNVKKEELDFDITNMTDEELEAKFTEVYEAAPAVSEDPADGNDTGEATSEDDEAKFALNTQIREALSAAVGSEKISDDWGTYSRYWMIDFDTEANEVYFIDENDWLLYGAPFEMDGDTAKVDMACKKRKKYAIVDFIEGSSDFSFQPVVTEIKETIINAKDAAYGELENKFNALEASIEKAKADQIQSEKDSLFSQFDAQLETVEEYKQLKLNNANYDVEALEKELFALVGKQTYKFEHKSDNIAAGIFPENDKSEYKPYGNLFD